MGELAKERPRQGMWRRGGQPNPSAPGHPAIPAAPLSERFFSGSVAKQGLSIPTKHSQQAGTWVNATSALAVGRGPSARPPPCHSFSAHSSGSSLKTEALQENIC